MTPRTFDSAYDNGALYDLINADFIKDISFYLHIIKKGESVLELGCGTGRVTLPLRAAGIDITALDLAPTMISSLREKAIAQNLKIKTIIGDLCDFQMNSTFDLIIVPYKALQHATDYKSIAGFFESIHKHLKPYGRFVIDVFNPSTELLSRSPRIRQLFSTYNDRNRRVSIIESNRYDAATQINHILWEHLDDRNVLLHKSKLTMRMFFPQELDALFRSNGFVIDAKYGDYDRSLFSSSSVNQIIIGSKK